MNKLTPIEELVNIRRQLNITCAYTAEALGLSVGMFRRIETGERKPELSVHRAYENFLRQCIEGSIKYPEDKRLKHFDVINHANVLLVDRAAKIIKRNRYNLSSIARYLGIPRSRLVRYLKQDTFMPVGIYNELRRFLDAKFKL